MQNSPDIHALNDITKILIDGSDLYDKAAEIADEGDTSATITALAAERRTLCASFQQKVREAGGEPASGGTLMGAGHKAFMELRAVAQNDTHAAVSEVERGEDFLRDEIRKRLDEKELSASVRDFLTQTLATIKPGHRKMSDLKRTYEN